MTDKKERKIPAIKDGTVIDHIDSENTLKVIKILKLKAEQLMIGINFDSKKMDKKGIIKVSDKKLLDKELQKISLVAPDASIIKIKDYKIIQKSKVNIPDEFFDIAICNNANCITNHQDLKTHFYTLQKKPLKLKCRFCEKIFDNGLNIKDD